MSLRRSTKTRKEYVNMYYILFEHVYVVIGGLVDVSTRKKFKQRKRFDQKKGSNKNICY